MAVPSQRGIDYWSVPAERLLEDLRSGPQGLGDAEARDRLGAYGPNVLKVRQRATAAGLFLKQFKSPLVLILLFGALVSAAVKDYADGFVILVIVAGSAVITFAQENAASRGVEKLRARLVHEVSVVRAGNTRATPAEGIVPGDIVLLAAGSLIPADGRVLEARDFFVSQAVLTGETFPVEKAPGDAPARSGLAERANCVFMGTTVRSGTARVVVAVTGAASEYGRIADRLSRRPPETEFERGIRRFGLMLSQVMVVLILVVFGTNIISVKPPLDSLLFAIALAVGISPELLPAIITINLSKGARGMARQGVIVRRLNSIENLGSMDVLCTDKTGTLTEGVVRLDGAYDAEGRLSEEVFRGAFLNAHFQTGLANPLDDAITGARAVELDGGTVKLDEIPYDFVRKRLSIIVRENGRAPRLIAKGALENVLADCAAVRREGGDVPLDEAGRERIRARFLDWSDHGFRVLGLAFKDVPERPIYGRSSPGSSGSRSSTSWPSRPSRKSSTPVPDLEPAPPHAPSLARGLHLFPERFPERRSDEQGYHVRASGGQSEAGLGLLQAGLRLADRPLERLLRRDHGARGQELGAQGEGRDQRRDVPARVQGRKAHGRRPRRLDRPGARRRQAGGRQGGPR